MNYAPQTWKERWQRAICIRATARESEAKPAAERVRLADAGMAGTDLCGDHCRHNGPTELMPRRLEQIGIDPGYVKVDRPSTYRDLERVCARCNAAQLCACDLAKGDVQSGMESYCPNGPTIDALLLDRPTGTA